MAREDIRRLDRQVVRRGDNFPLRDPNISDPSENSDMFEDMMDLQGTEVPYNNEDEGLEPMEYESRRAGGTHHDRIAQALGGEQPYRPQQSNRGANRFLNDRMGGRLGTSTGRGGALMDYLTDDPGYADENPDAIGDVVPSRWNKSRQPVHQREWPSRR